MAYMYQAELWCDSCGEDLLRTIPAPGAIYDCRGSCKRRFEPNEVPGWPDGSLGVTCWYDCPDCWGPVALDDYAFDSDDYPKYCGNEEDSDQASDSPSHCAAGGDCLEAIDLAEWGLAPEAGLVGAEQRRIGALLSDCLTETGTEWLVELLRDSVSNPETLTPYQEALHAFWRAAFSDALWNQDIEEEEEDPEDCESESENEI